MAKQTIREGEEEHGDPRIGIREDKGFVQRTVHKFSDNPFKSGGAQEQGDASAGYATEPGPSGGRKLKADRIYDRVNDKEVGRKFSDAESSRKPRVDR